MSAVTKATLPPVKCAAWCQDGAGHIDAWHPTDQYCMSESGGEDVELTAHAAAR